jgi:hypothetical protein
MFLLYSAANAMSTSVETNLSQIKQDMSLVGMAKLKFLFWDIYDSELYTPTGKYQQNENQVLLEITYLRNIKSKDLLDKTVEQWQYIGIDESEYRAYLSQLEAIWPDIKVGDELSLYTQDKHSYFYLNERHIGTITSDKFGEIFKGIWLSESTSQPKLREALLAGNTI